MSGQHPARERKGDRRNLAVAAACGVLVGAMMGAALRRCRSTTGSAAPPGSAARPQVATSRARRRCSPARSWCGSTPTSRAACRGGSSRKPNSIEVRVGEIVTVNYTVTNLSARETVGQASYNVSPPTVGAYFTKINCFCFTDQRLKAGRNP